MSRYEIHDIKAAADGQWAAIINNVAGIGDDYLNSRRHGPCPKCGGNDRWRFTNHQDGGGAICNNCGRFGDGLELIKWFTGLAFPEVVEKIGDYLKLTPDQRPKTIAAPKPKSKKHVRKELIPLTTVKAEPWQPGKQNESIVKSWCNRKRLTIKGVLAAKIHLIKYRKRFFLIGFPVQGECGEIVGWTLYDPYSDRVPHWDPDKKEYSYLPVKTIKLKEKG